MSGRRCAKHERLRPGGQTSAAKNSCRYACRRAHDCIKSMRSTSATARKGKFCRASSSVVGYSSMAGGRAASALGVWCVKEGGMGGSGEHIRLSLKGGCVEKSMEGYPIIDSAFVSFTGAAACFFYSARRPKHRPKFESSKVRLVHKVFRSLERRDHFQFWPAEKANKSKFR